MMQKEKHQNSFVAKTTEDVDVDSREKEASGLKNTRVKSGSSQLKEWNAIDFDEVTEFFSQSPTIMGLKKIQDTDEISGGSPAQSFSSQLSNLLMSRSFEKATPIQSVSSGFQFRNHSIGDGIHIQRSPSMDSLELVDDADANASSRGRRSHGWMVGLGIEGTVIDEQEYPVASQDTTIAAVDNVSDVHPKEHPRNDSDYLRELMKRQEKHFFLRHKAMTDDQVAEFGNIRTGESPPPRKSSLPSSK